jgi:hypothetical protein
VRPRIETICRSLVAVVTALGAACSAAQPESAPSGEATTHESDTSDGPATSTTTTQLVVTPTSVPPALVPANRGCDGSVLLDAMVDDVRLIVTEVPDGSTICIADGSAVALTGRPTGSTSVPQLFNSGSVPRNYWVFALPHDVPSVVTVRDSDGGELPAGRGLTGDYLVVLDPAAGSANGAAAPGPMRIAEVLDGQARVVARLLLQGPDQSATFEDFMACVRDNGVDMPPPLSPGETPAPREPTPQEKLRAAWQMCRDLLFSWMAGNQQGGIEFLENERFVNDCLAEAGYFPMLSEPRLDEAAYNQAFEDCRALSPGRTELVDCLRANGLDIVIDGQQSIGPHQPEVAGPAWQACRDTFVIWEVPNPILVPDRIRPLDCLAAKGWIGSVVRPTDFGTPEYVVARSECASA